MSCSLNVVSTHYQMLIFILGSLRVYEQMLFTQNEGIFFERAVQVCALDFRFFPSMLFHGGCYLYQVGSGTFIYTS